MSTMKSAHSRNIMPYKWEACFVLFHKYRKLLEQGRRPKGPRQLLEEGLCKGSPAALLQDLSFGTILQIIYAKLILKTSEIATA